ncbi:hypothetical protein Dda_7931 [Drechslerella dactyloides]|uniref:Uncharacterized protein n=1 Tax=Drechslerella dactyloides TaxID=74499 RepID=A0AAD6NG96_DREDA|nr:hypothetical protein Dda_7931 [Drechslerella dactyloides]
MFEVTMEDTSGPRRGLPESVEKTNNVLRSLVGHSRYTSYDNYLSSARREFLDLEWIYEELHFLDSDPNALGTAVYALDIGTFDENHVSKHSITSSSAKTAAGDVAELLKNPPAGTKMRVLIMEHGVGLDQDLIMEIASFYDINPRVLHGHFLNYTTGNAIDVWVHEDNTQSDYLPSEAEFSPIRLDKRSSTGRKRTTLLIPRDQELGYETVVVFVWNSMGRYPKEIINRDLIIPTQRMGRLEIENLQQPSGDAETCFFRLSNLSGPELEACISQPISIALPFIRTYLLEISQNINQIQYRINAAGISGLEDTRDLQPDEMDDWSPSVQAHPLRKFDEFDDAFVTSIDSIHDHLTSAPWVDPGMAYAGRPSAEPMVKLIRADTKRLQDQMTRLRTKVHTLAASRQILPVDANI